MTEPIMINSWRKGDFGRLAIFETPNGLLLMTEREWSRRTSYGEHGARVVTVSHAFSTGSSDILIPAELVAEIHAFITEPVVLSSLLGEPT